MRKFPGLAADHWLVRERHQCPVCGEVFNPGDETTLVVVRPADEEDEAKKAAGRPYTALAEAVHWWCVTPSGDEP
jgi:hypothetical protein